MKRLLCIAALVFALPAMAQTYKAPRTAFGDPDCLKMVLDWRHCQ